MRKFEGNYAVKLLELCRQTICLDFLQKIFGVFLTNLYLCRQNYKNETLHEAKS